MEENQYKKTGNDAKGRERLKTNRREKVREGKSIEMDDGTQREDMMAE